MDGRPADADVAGGVWEHYFPTKRAEAQARYQAAKTIFQQIALEAGGLPTVPTVVARTPLPGATGVALTTPVTALFSEALNPATVTTSTVTLQGPGTTPVPATVTYTPGTFTATLTPSTSLLLSTTYTATVKGGPTGVTDTAGTPLATDVTWTFTTGTGGAGATCPCTIWPGTATPTNVADSDTSAVELGVKFRANVAGSITALRFYKGATNTGTHVGNLWTSTGTLLASVTFTNETASGWQQATFASPVAITANTTYVASYHTNVGHYAGDTNYFASGVTNGPLTALGNGTDGGNGVYLYGAGGFPTQTWQAANYWVDVVFTTSGGGGDLTPPTVTGQSPASGATGVPTTTAVTATFSEAMNASTLTTSTVTLRTGSTTVPATVSYTPTTFTATLTPT